MASATTAVAAASKKVADKLAAAESYDEEDMFN